MICERNVMCVMYFIGEHSRIRSSICSKSTQPTFTGEHLKCQCCCSAGVSVSLESSGYMGGMRVDKECLMNETELFCLHIMPTETKHVESFQ